MSGDKRSPLEIKVDDNIRRTNRKINKIGKKNSLQRNKLKKKLQKEREYRLKQVKKQMGKKSAQNIDRLRRNKMLVSAPRSIATVPGTRHSRHFL